MLPVLRGVTSRVGAGSRVMAHPSVCARSCASQAQVADFFSPDVPVTAEHDKEAFLSVFEHLMGSIRNDFEQNMTVPESTVGWVDEMSRYNVLGGKMNRGLSVVSAYRSLKDEAELTPCEFQEAAALGWCVEWLQASFLVADDIMDGSITRRGQPCWYKQDHVKSVAINDSLILESTIYNILRWQFKGHQCYPELIELFHDMTYKTDIGQNLDLITAPENMVDLSRFSMERYKQIVKYKTAYYSFYLPVALAMRLYGITDPRLYAVAEDILVDIGEFFQVQDDYLDCYGDPKVSGKIGTDIEDNKCGWIINQALLVCSPEQRAILDTHYGRKSAESVVKVKEVYEDLNLRSVYADYEKASYERIMAKIHGLENVLPHSVFTDFVAKIYKRDK